ncbi:hypothetical protein BC792_10882 [Sphingobacterium allocomposti]|jgi:hypothetical protein|uniref:Uncharacterized protein n=1 Tax=Sphingobacterium allocomposti TaxID=415956 RepID=A0A5S5DJ58_9SPHI|nr:hypothetical protein [Sphingobacterium composti Yoo et al. 2007 non Ten et al. 2007]TYP95990.1 hypothetical protein BC792_10882 [Sphingobacterium composti Yoo et al. 2007 non Ten et al. 2007]HLS95303.1 hypothetical protein [Sphingobacterium sp.]
MENNYQLSRIHNYINGLMSREEMHALEREALDDPFLQDAIDGYRLQHGVDAKSLSLLQQRLERRVEEHAQQKHRHYFGWQRLAIGLTAAVLFIAICTLLLIRYLPNTGKQNVTEVELMDEALTAIKVQSIAGGDAQPMEGWNSFSQYLKKHYSGRNTERHLEVSFKVDKNGAVYAVRVVGGQSPEMNQEIARLLQRGPKWTGSEGRIRITFPE